MTLKRFSFFAILAVLLASCTTPITPVFTFSPDMPKAGQTITFTNATSDGELWNWTFGDERTSTVHSPSHVYTKAGVYTVTLMVDSNKNYVTAKEITVYDSVPSIYITENKVDYYATVHFKVLAYNPYGYEVTYKWQFSENAYSDSIHSGIATCKEVPVYFVKHDQNEIVKLDITIGDSSYSVLDTFYVHNVKARSLLMAQADGNVLRQRLFDNGLEDRLNTEIPSGNHTFNISAENDKLYLFEAGSVFADPLSSVAGDGKIRVVNMTDNSSSILIQNNTSNLHNFYNGFVGSDYLLWSDYYNFIYKTDKNASLGNFTYSGYDEQTTVPYYLVKVDRLGYYGNGMEKGQINGSVAVYDNTYFWAKGGTGKGIYRFETSDILSTNVLVKGVNPQTGAILTDCAIRSFVIDPIHQMIYYSVTSPAEKVGLWVCRINGTFPVRIDDSPLTDENSYMTGIVVDNVSNYVYWSYNSPEFYGKAAPSGSWESYYTSNPLRRSGVKRTKLVKNYSSIFSIDYLTPNVNVYGLAIDENLK